MIKINRIIKMPMEQMKSKSNYHSRKVPNLICIISKLAGVDWLRCFMRRRDLSLRKSEGTSITRICGFNNQEVNEFFDVYTKTIEKHGIKEEDTHNCNETPCYSESKENSSCSRG
ncbi:hypothetical protein QAD02_006803 [Eretmocerus hayati]|uniref:Uncharacterized protein n=1 Tax=Eretmocerus hayati TaxID=131215 RepID=A0ACC2N330_9HYME|nr:hypothetical protein QAD02_006803 [Eretmocerus hayati]